MSTTPLFDTMKNAHIHNDAIKTAMAADNYRQLVTALKAAREDGWPVTCKLNAKHDLLKEVGRELLNMTAATELPNDHLHELAASILADHNAAEAVSNGKAKPPVKTKKQKFLEAAANAPRPGRTEQSEDERIDSLVRPEQRAFHAKVAEAEALQERQDALESEQQPTPEPVIQPTVAERTLAYSLASVYLLGYMALTVVVWFCRAYLAVVTKWLPYATDCKALFTAWAQARYREHGWVLRPHRLVSLANTLVG